MIKIFIKYKIYEYCIDLFFKALHKNFIHKSHKVPKKGDFHKELIITNIGVLSNDITVLKDILIVGVDQLRFMQDINIYRIYTNVENVIYWSEEMSFCG